jgi:DNA mismatch endonuclease (patch repair protein)
MADVFSKKKRSAIMAAIHGKHTKPEKALKKLLRAGSIRYRSHDPSLPGTPDIVLPAQKIAVFINGCFWHGHLGCPRSKLPSTNTAFWTNKISGNMRRDRVQKRALRRLGWRVRVFWTCRKLNTFGSKLVVAV